MGPVEILKKVALTPGQGPWECVRGCSHRAVCKRSEFNEASLHAGKHPPATGQRDKGGSMPGACVQHGTTFATGSPFSKQDAHRTGGVHDDEAKAQLLGCYRVGDGDKPHQASSRNW